MCKKARKAPGLLKNADNIILTDRGRLSLENTAINIEKMTAEIDLMENAAYVIKDGHLTKVTPKQFGEDIIIWQNGKVHDVVRSQRTRINGQDVI